jgi:hypothetical protein
MAFLLIELGSRAVNGYFQSPSAASGALARHRTNHPGRWLMLEVRREADRPHGETALPPVLEEQRRFSNGTGT